jgi:uncharacterized protein (DUF58 family)
MLQNKIRYLFLLILISILSVLYNEYVMCIIILGLLIMPVFLLLHVCYLYRKVDARLESAVHVSGKGEQIPVSIQMNNPTIFPVLDLKIYLTVQNGFSRKQYAKELFISMDARSSQRITCYLQSEFSGNLEVCLKKIRCYDYLRLFSMQRKLKDAVKIAVMPEFYEINENHICNRNQMIVESDHYSSIKSGDDPSEVYAIREYREGDRPQQIHWKLSRKQNQLMIKEFSDPINCSALAFIDLFVPLEKNALAYMDALLECALSVSYSFLKKRQIHYLAWFDNENGVCRSVRIEHEKDLYEAVDGLLQANPYTSRTDALAACLAQNPYSQLTDLINITGDSDFGVDFMTLIHAGTKRVIYIGDAVSVSDDIVEMENIGLKLSMVNIKNVREDIENLSIG